MANASLIRSSILLLFLLLLAGCNGWLGEILEDGCALAEDSSHCYQQAALQQEDPSLCEKVQGFGGTSNPPKDKCYLMLAQNTGNYEHCEKMEGGFGSYEQEECYRTLAVSKVDPQGCKYLSGEEFERCKKAVSEEITKESIDAIDKELEELKSKLAQDPQNKELMDQLAKLQKRKDGLYEFADPSIQAAYFKEKREALLDDVDDEEVKLAILQQTRDYRDKNPSIKVEELLAKMEDFKEQQQTMKRLDNEANKIMEDLKGKIVDYTDEKKQEAINAVTEKGWTWMKDNSGDQMKENMEKLEAMKAKYDKTSEQFQELQQKIDKYKKVYEEVSEVYGKVDQYNKLLAEGKIDQGQAKVLKGAVILGKGLEYATSYVPVFGETASTISKETFDAAIKLAKERAQRTTAINKCIEDPENCDPNGISAY